MSIHIGIGGWTFEPWRGAFYPAGLAQKRELEYAGQHLTGIEINGTYYGSQKPETFANWAAAVPDGFQFSVKASRFTTNRRVLADGAASIEKFLTQGLTRLDDRLGPIHWQFMATKKFERDDFAGVFEANLAAGLAVLAGLDENAAGILEQCAFEEQECAVFLEAVHEHDVVAVVGVAWPAPFDAFRQRAGKDNGAELFEFLLPGPGFA